MRFIRLEKMTMRRSTWSLVPFALLLLAISSGAVSAEEARVADDPVVAVAGDISCSPNDSRYNGGNGTSTACRQKSTAALVKSLNPAAVFALGDTQYESATTGGY